MALGKSTLIMHIIWIEFLACFDLDLQFDKFALLKYKNNRPVINSIKLISKPGRRIYYSINQIWKINSNKSFIIFSTNQGLKSIIDCKKYKIGGEPFIVIN